MTDIYINGRFLMARQSGVQRVARRLVLALDALLNENPDAKHQYILVCPEGDTDLALRSISMLRLPSKGQCFEQAGLTKAAAGGLLVNLANTGPVAHNNSIVMMHDAQVWTAPDSYSRAFRLWYKIIQPLLGRRARKILTVSAFSAGNLMEHGVVKKPPAVIHNGVDHILDAEAEPRILDRLGVASNSYVFAFASPQPHKNAKLLLDVAKLPGAPAMVLAGALPEGETAPDNVKMTGKISDGELRALYESALCFALPSTTEGFGLPAGEAMTCGCPVLAANAGALAEVYSGAAVMLHPHTPAQWLSAIADLAGDPEKREALIDKGRQRAAALTWTRAAENLHRLIDETLKEDTR
ncbi:glycosyltransferase family 4 protein [Hyphococcus sp.]|uniref:glycosyltransferase family 4 protein n=1 Tax=Hyphococcus sp. TaxID=2038636 RepID=UPI003D143B8B